VAPCHLVRQNHTQCITRHLYGLCNSDDEDVVLPAVMLPPVVVIFLPGATEADVDIVAKLGAANIIAINTAATIKPLNLKVSCIM
jgi:hypothetical protein